LEGGGRGLPGEVEKKLEETLVRTVTTTPNCSYFCCVGHVLEGMSSF